jgi:type I restriction enzyme M protein
VKALKEERKELALEVKDAKKLAKGEGKDTPAKAKTQEKRMEEIDKQLEKHAALDAELKKLKANIREVEKQKDEMVAAARAKISEEEAKELILGRFKKLLIEQFESYLRQYQRAFIAGVENLWTKYAVTSKQIIAERDKESSQLNAYLKELGYE